MDDTKRDTDTASFDKPSSFWNNCDGVPALIMLHDGPMLSGGIDGC